MNNKKIYWNGTKSELIELCYALHVCKLIENYEGKPLSFLDICKFLFDNLNMKCPEYPYLRISQMKRRKKKDACSFLFMAYKKVFNS